MWNYLQSSQRQQPVAPMPSPVTITGIRFPADGTNPHLLSLTTTTDGVKDAGDSPWGHIPDMRSFWKAERAWKWRDFETFRLKNQPLSSCNGLYVLYFSFDKESLPVNTNFPVAVFGRERSFAGDAFVARLQGNEIGEDLGEDGWAAWRDVPSEVLSLPVMRM